MVIALLANGDLRCVSPELWAVDVDGDHQRGSQHSDDFRKAPAEAAGPLGRSCALQDRLAALLASGDTVIDQLPAGMEQGIEKALSCPDPLEVRHMEALVEDKRVEAIGGQSGKW